MFYPHAVYMVGHLYIYIMHASTLDLPLHSRAQLVVRMCFHINKATTKCPLQTVARGCPDMFIAFGN